MPGFRIISIQSEYKPLQWHFPEINLETGLSASSESARTLDCIFINSTARSTIFDHITWAQDTLANSVEQGGLLVGRSFTNEKCNLVYSIAEYAIPAFSADGSMAYLKFSHTTWKLMLDEFDLLTQSIKDSDLQIVGWYHTHPGRLSVFMSGTDLNTQKKMFSKDWQFAIVLNPQKKVWRAFRGESAIECKGEMIN